MRPNNEKWFVKTILVLAFCMVGLSITNAAEGLDVVLMSKDAGDLFGSQKAQLHIRGDMGEKQIPIS